LVAVVEQPVIEPTASAAAATMVSSGFFMAEFL
jgi:hypothetical protein